MKKFTERSIQAVIGDYDELLTLVKKQKLRWFSQTILQGTVKGKRRTNTKVTFCIFCTDSFFYKKTQHCVTLYKIRPLNILSAPYLNLHGFTNQPFYTLCRFCRYFQIGLLVPALLQLEHLAYTNKNQTMFWY